MIKRDTIQRYRLIPTKDSQGGKSWDKEPHETVRAHVSINATFGEINQYGIKNEQLIHTTTDIKLDEYVNSRYAFNGKLFKLIRQVKLGNEYFSALLETTE